MKEYDEVVFIAAKYKGYILCDVCLSENLPGFMKGVGNFCRYERTFVKRVEDPILAEIVDEMISAYRQTCGDKNSKMVAAQVAGRAFIERKEVKR